ncbi:MAG TPA: hypothetical protein VEX36_07680 [Thermoleophilaceae bacterium]|nr:hypothetical protein [Thermoleophilaceae bacterium]
MATMRDIRARLALLLAVASAVCIVAAGCGGGEDAPAATDGPEPRTAPAFAEYVAELLGQADDAQDCQRVEQIDRRSSAEIPCPAPAALREQMDDFAMIDSELYNSDRSAVVNYDYGDRAVTASMVLLQDYDLRWTVQQLGFSPEQPSGNTRGDGYPNLRRTIRSYEAAVRERDCDEMIRLTYRPAGADRPSCKEQLAETAQLGKVLKRDPSQRPAFNGGDQDFGFYSMTAYHPAPTHYTFTVVRVRFGGEDRFLVSDVVRDEG